MFKTKRAKLTVGLLTVVGLITTPLIISSCSKSKSNLELEAIYEKKDQNLNALVLHSTYNFELTNPLVYNNETKAFNFDNNTDLVEQKDHIELINSKAALDQYLENRVVPNLNQASLSDLIKDHFKDFDFSQQTILLVKNIRDSLDLSNLKLESGWNISSFRQSTNRFKINLVFDQKDETQSTNKVVSTKTFFITINKLSSFRFARVDLVGSKTTSSTNSK
ncbi:hypothetical protein JM47_00485 [Ureaplasma diversum]|uniref:Lipoprotein n=1 Tax=Ureaplasma diversum TaxID=42094 RepID=A0A0C5S178_9BACT|nr:hypothetical protein [Ureaplasma diversum]AJQ45135.1 hypothetical protein JM47_00485 [Ureaplasma diversum]